ncbi:hypothetical protein THAOC_20194, partial [Thalassiosira oceanica]
LRMEGYSVPVLRSKGPATPKGRTNPHRHFLSLDRACAWSKMKIEVPVRLLYQVAHLKALGLGTTERASGRPGEAQKARIYRKFERASVRECPSIGKTLPAADLELESCRAGQTDGSLRMGRKVASRNRLVEPYKSL